MKLKQYQHPSKNPFRIIFICFACLCCLILTLVFSWIMFDRNKEIQNFYYQEKARMLSENLNSQLLSLEDLTQQLSINSAYRPSLVFKQKYNEVELLKTWKTYQDFSFFAKDLFLYYKESRNVFLTTGNTCDLYLYLDGLTEEEMSYIIPELTEPGSKLSLLSFQKKLYIFIPFHSVFDNMKNPIVLGNIICHDTLTEYFNLVSGGINGIISLYWDGELLYSSAENPAMMDSKDVLTATADGRLVLCYLPDSIPFSFDKLLISLTFIIVNILVLMVISHLFATKTYKPLAAIQQKYKNQHISAESQYKNVFDEIEAIIDNTLQYSTQAAEQITEKSTLLKQQVLLLLLNGTYSFDIQAYMNKLSIQLPGPFYFVSAIFFRDESVDDAFLTMLKKELEENYSPSDAGLVYVFCNYKQKRLYLICSLNAANKKDEMLDEIFAVVDSFTWHPAMGTGKTYTDITKLSASYLESLEHLNQNKEVDISKSESVFDISDTSWITELFYHATAEEALEDLDRHIASLQSANVSLLLQQYLFSSFIGIMGNLCHTNGISLSHDAMSLAVSARNLDVFQESARTLVKEFYEKLIQRQEQELYNEALQICTYCERTLYGL